MTIKVGDKVPSITFKHLGSDGMEDISTKDLFEGKKIVLFAVPGAFTPTCSAKHVPGFLEHAAEIKSKGVDKIVCLSVNDAFVMDAWQKDQNAEHITMLADGNAEFTKALGMVLDASGFGMGTRSKRFAMIVNDGIVEYLGVDDKGVDKSSAETVIAHLA